MSEPRYVMNPEGTATGKFICVICKQEVFSGNHTCASSQGFEALQSELSDLRSKLAESEDEVNVWKERHSSLDRLTMNRIEELNADHTEIFHELEAAKRTISALTKAGDAMAEQIGYIGNYRDDMKRVEAWHEAKKG